MTTRGGAIAQVVGRLQRALQLLEAPHGPAWGLAVAAYRRMAAQAVAARSAVAAGMRSLSS
jgi:hypothetical protein